MDVVTGSFGFIGKYITEELLNRGRMVKTITTHPNKPSPFGEKVKSSPFHFNEPETLTQYLTDCDTLFNTYWIRFDYRRWSFDQAFENTKVLFNCAKKAKIKKIVHISVTNPDLQDPLPYYRGKALQEEALKMTGIDFAIIRPTLVFGIEDILINNIAWTIRKFPVVPIFGSGKYKVQPVFVRDLASIAADQSEYKGSRMLDAIGPETYCYDDFLKLIATELSRDIPLIHIHPSLGILLGRLIGVFVNDVVLTKDELRGLMLNKLISNQTPNGRTLISEWLRKNKDIIGTSYTSELKRHFYWKAMT